MTDNAALRIHAPDVLRSPSLTPVLAVLPEARLVGGIVRDILAGRPVADVDLATPLPPDEVMRRLEAANIKAVPTGLAHGTVTAVAGPHPVEITTLRRDVETDGRHAVVAFTDDWKADAARRDFTINAMSMTAGGAVFDYFGGIEDLRAGRVRFVGDPATRIAEDYLRVLRYFRFFARYGAEPPAGAVRDALRAGASGLGRLSAERVWSELKRILSAPDPGGSVRLMEQLGVLQAAIPEGADAGSLARLIASGAPADPILRLAALLTGEPGALSDRLKLSTEERERLLLLQSGPVPRPDDDDAALRRLLADHDKALLIDRTWLGGRRDSQWAGLRARLAAMAPPSFPLEGRDVLALGIPPGPEVGRMLREVRAWWLAGGCSADAGACRAELRRLAARLRLDPHL